MSAYLAYAFSRILLKLIQCLPFSALRGVARVVGSIVWLVDLRHRKLVQRNLSIAFEAEKSFEEIQKLTKACFQRFIYSSLAAVWIADRSTEDVSRLFELKGVNENLLPAVRKGKGVVHVMFHMGNWELLSRIVTQIPEVKFSTIYQPLKNKHFDQLVQKWRNRDGVGLIDRHHGFRDAVSKLRKGEAVGMLVDQHAGDHGMWLPFFGRLASTTTLPSLLARRTGAAIVPIFCSSNVKTGKWTIEFAPEIKTLDKSDGEIMHQVHRELEKRIHEDIPNWFWLHNRWKTPSPHILFPHYKRGFYFPPSVTLKKFRVLVRSTNWLGDAVLTLPAIESIKKGRPDCEVHVMSPAKLAELYKNCDFVDQVYSSYDEIKAENFDAAVILPNSFRSAWECWKLGIPRRFGYGGHSRGMLLTAICPESYRAGKFEHDVKDFCGLARWMGGEITSGIPSIRKGNRRVESNLVVLHPGAAFGTAKRWFGERFVEVVNSLPEKKWVVIGSRDEMSRNESLVRSMKGKVEDTTGKLTLTQLIELFSKASLAVCNDSGPMHLAAAIGVPVVAIFGSTEPTHTGPLGTNHQVLRKIVECSPCYQRECPIDLRCMKSVEAREVIEAIRKLDDLNQVPRSSQTVSMSEMI